MTPVFYMFKNTSTATFIFRSHYEEARSIFWKDKTQNANNEKSFSETRDSFDTFWKYFDSDFFQKGIRKISTTQYSIRNDSSIQSLNIAAINSQPQNCFAENIIQVLSDNVRRFSGADYYLFDLIALDVTKEIVSKPKHSHWVVYRWHIPNCYVCGLTALKNSSRPNCVDPLTRICSRCESKFKRNPIKARDSMSAHNRIFKKFKEGKIYPEIKVNIQYSN